ncbi:MAG: ribosome biogenesis GTPase Der [bacterium]|nr:ribosome biogenesis GTPase Der [bacterium]
MSKSQPIVAIVGRPNVGKSTLYNRLVGQRRAITADLPGTTRDRIYGEAEWQGQAFTVIDTGGLTAGDGGKDSEDGHLGKAVKEQVVNAIEESDLVLLVVSARDGLTGEDREAAALVRKRSRPVLLVVNKVDDGTGPGGAEPADEFHRLGFESIAISALHGKGTGDLMDEITSQIGKVKASGEGRPPAFTIVGRPNAGKSTLVNRLSDGRTALTSEVPHTTRDTTERLLKTPQRTWRLIDTAGMAKRGKRSSGIPYWSLLRTLRAIADSAVAVLLIDAEEGPTLQDAHIAAHILDSGTGLVLAVNKWDLVDKGPDVQERFFAKLRKRLPFLPSPPVVFVSALTGEKADRILRAVEDVYEAAETRVGTAQLNTLVRTRLGEYAGGRRKARLYYLTQVSTLPPTFVVFVNQPTLWGEDQRRHLAGVLRDEFELYGVAPKLEFRKSEGKPKKEAA